MGAQVCAAVEPENSQIEEKNAPDTLKVLAAGMAEFKDIVDRHLNNRESSKLNESDVAGSKGAGSSPSPQAGRETSLGRIIKRISWLKAWPDNNIPELEKVEEQIQGLQHLYRSVDYETSTILNTLTKIIAKLNEALESRKPGLLFLFELERELRNCLSKKVSEVIEEARYYFELNTTRVCDMINTFADKFNEQGHMDLAYQFRVLKTELNFLEKEVSSLAEKPNRVFRQHLECINQMKSRLIHDKDSMEQEHQSIISLDEFSKHQNDSISLAENITVETLVLRSKYTLKKFEKHTSATSEMFFPSMKRRSQSIRVSNQSELTQEESRTNFVINVSKPEKHRPRFYSADNPRDGSFTFNLSIPSVPKLGTRKSSLQFHIPELESFVEGYVMSESNDAMAVFMSLALDCHVPEMSVLCEATAKAVSGTGNKTECHHWKLSNSMLCNPQRKASDSQGYVTFNLRLGLVGYYAGMMVRFSLRWAYTCNSITTGS